MDYKGQPLLTDIEKELIEKVLNFSLTIGSTTVCFKDIADKLELDLSQNKSEEETIPVEQLEKERDAINDELYELRKEFEHTIDEDKRLRKLYGPDYRNNPEQSKALDDLRNRLRRISDFIWPQLERIQDNLDQEIDKGGKISTPLRGFFSSTNQTVYLCLKNINNLLTSKYDKRENTLIPTFVHEMFHAWNYFASDQNNRSVKEIDEPMVEYAALIFLNEIAKTHPEFDEIMYFAGRSVEEKKKSIGSTAAYGFGHYLYKHALNNPADMELLEAYSPISSKIAPTRADVQEAVELLRPTYPVSQEEKALELFKKIILSKPSTKTIPITPFTTYLSTLGKSPRTIDGYDNALRRKIPQLIRNVLCEPCNSVYDITDYNDLCSLDKRLWSNPTIAQINLKAHRIMSSAFHKYMEYIKSL